MEGNYVFTKWCKDRGYPNSYVALKKANPDLSTEELDKKWDRILSQFDENNTSKKGVITPRSFGQHLKKE